MQSKTSCFNSTIFKKNILHYWPIWVIYSLYTLFMVPVSIYFNTIMLNAESLAFTAEELQKQKTWYFIRIIELALNPLTCAIIGLVSAIAVFYFLYNARSAHAYHSFPVTRKELFITNYFSGFLFFTVPQLLAFLLGVIVCALKGVTTLEYMLYWFLLMEGMCFFFYNMAILLGMFTGLLFAIPVLFVIANFLYVGCRYVITVLMGVIGYGLMDIYAQRSSSILSPLAFMMAKLSVSYNYDDKYEAFNLAGSHFIVVYAVAGIVFGIVAYCLYKKRRIEMTGDILGLKWIKPIMRWVFAAIASMLFAIVLTIVFPHELIKGKEFPLVSVSILIVGVIAFFLGEMILEKKTNIFKKNRLVECGVYSLLMMLFLAAMEYNVFGVESKQPKPEEISSACISMYYPLYQDDEAGIQEVLDIHKQIIDSKAEFEKFCNSKSFYQNCRYISVRYVLKNGTPFIRNYYVPADDAYYADKTSVAAKLTEKSCDPELYIRGNLCTNFDEVKLSRISLEVYNQNLVFHTTEVESNLYEEFLAALKADVSAGNLIDRGETLYEVGEDFYYLNFLSIDISGKKIKTVFDSMYGGPDESGISNMSQVISLSRNCVHMLGFFEKYGVIDEQDRMMLTSKEYEERRDKLEEQ